MTTTDCDRAASGPHTIGKEIAQCDDCGPNK
jgi:hypothetical protein